MLRSLSDVSDTDTEVRLVFTRQDGPSLTALESEPSRDVEWRNRRYEEHDGRSVFCLDMDFSVAHRLIIATELTDSTNIAQAFAYIPATWAIGVTAGWVLVLRLNVAIYGC